MINQTAPGGPSVPVTNRFTKGIFRESFCRAQAVAVAPLQSLRLTNHFTKELDGSETLEGFSSCWPAGECEAGYETLLWIQKGTSPVSALCPVLNCQLG